MVGVSKTTQFAFVLLLSAFAGSASAAQPAHAAQPPLTLDGVGTSSSCGVFMNNTRVCDAQSLTTAHGRDVIILVVEDSVSVRDDPTTVSSIIDSSGLTFTPRISYTPNAKLWEYFARATSPLISDNITVVFSHDVEGVAVTQVLAIHGANAQAIFDPNPSIPATIPCSYAGCSASMQTSAFDFIIASVAINDGKGCGSPLPEGFQPPRGFTNIAYTGWIQVDYATTTTLESSVTYDCHSSETTDAMAIVVDGISFNGAFGR